jgi:Tol biopolymer transport system component
MLRRILSCFALPLFLFSLLLMPPREGGAESALGAFNPGPDVIAGDMHDLYEDGITGTQHGLAVGITSCNTGNQLVNFFAMPGTNHPAVAQNLYRMSGGAGNNDRFEQIGQAWVKHTYGAKQANDCSFGCQPGGDFNHLGVGCSDMYFNFQSATQSDLGSRAWINPFTGVFQSSARDHTGHAHSAVSHMLVVQNADLNTTMNPGATYYAELLYVTPDEYAWCQTHPGECNMYNNSSYRRYNVSGTTSFTFSEVGETMRMTPPLHAWTGATISTIEPALGVDGRALIAYKVTGPVAGVWHYEYAIYNQNLDRAIQSFSVPLGCGITVSNLGFHAPPNHPGFPNDGTQGDAGFSNAAWTSNQTANDVNWNTETFAQNQNANAIRWGTLYNFRFDSTKPPLAVNATIGFFKTGAPVTVGILGPNACDVVPSPTPTLTPGVTPPPTPTPTPTSTPTPTPSPTATPSTTPSPVPTPILPPGGNGKIVFQSARDGNDSDIYVMDPDGSNLTNLTDNLFLFIPDHDPDWSPDGTKIVFSVNVDEFSQDNIYLMDANGANAVQLTSISKDFGPAWSPDGTKIAFGSQRDGNSEVYVMNANGSNQTNLTNNPAPDGAFGLCWSPDGGKIAFTSNRGSGLEIYVMAADGSNQVQLTNRPGDVTGPAWSPDGTKIAFANLVSPSNDIFVINANGSNPIALTNGPGANFEPNWSPDGTKIVFTSTRDPGGPFGPNYEVYVMDANGSNQTNLTNIAAPDLRPDWQRLAPPPSPTPTPIPAAQPLNLSTRVKVQTGDNIGIAGFIVTGTAPKHLLLRAIGPSLTTIAGALADPLLELHRSGAATITNDNWRGDPLQEAAILATGLAPTNNLESAIDATLNPGAYTAVVRGKNNTSGVALVEVYDLSQAVLAKLANISTRAFVSTGTDIVIAGFILGGQTGDDRIVVRGIGPSLTALGVANALANPTLELRDNNGALLVSNNDWQDDPAQAAEISAAGLAPANQLEACIAARLPPGLYTALLAGVNHGTGVGLVEVYDRGAP